MKFPTRIYKVYENNNYIGSLGIYDGDGHEEWSYPKESDSKDFWWNISTDKIRKEIENNINKEEFLSSNYRIKRLKQYSTKFNCPQCGKIGNVSFQKTKIDILEFPILTIVPKSLSNGFISSNECLNIEIICDSCGIIRNYF